MDVIGHDAPCYQHVPIIIKSQQRVLNQSCDGRVYQVASAVPPIERGIDGINAITRPQPIQIVSQTCGKAVRKPKHNMLN